MPTFIVTPLLRNYMFPTWYKSKTTKEVPIAKSPRIKHLM